MSYEFQYREYAEALYDALVEDAFYITMEQSIADSQEAKEGLLKYLDYSMVESAQYGELLLPEGDKIGCSIWSKPITPEQSAAKSKAKKEFLLKHMGQNSLDTYNAIVGSMSACTEGLVSDDDWYLSILGLLPEYQGQGLGSSLVMPVLKEADRLGVASYIETFTPRNKTFYQRLGYVEIGAFKEPTTKTEFAVMRREPQKSKG